MLPRCTYNSVMLMKRPFSMNTLMKVLKLMHTQYKWWDEKSSNLYDVLMLEACFHAVWVECNGTLYEEPIG